MTSTTTPPSLHGLKVLLADGHTRQALPMAKALHGLGCEVTALCNSRWDLGYRSRWVDHRKLGPAALKDPAGFLQCLVGLLQNESYDVVIPLLDGSATVISEHKQEIAALSRPAICDWPVFIQARDKLLTMQACVAAGVPAPITYSQDELKNPAKLAFPVVVKPRISYSALGFSRVDDPAKLADVVAATEQQYGPALVQEYIPQTGLQYKAELMVDDSGETKAAVVFSKVRWYPIEGGSSTLNVTENRPDIVQSCTRLLNHVGWRGYADVDLIEDPRDGLAKVMEINPRITGSVKIAFEAGVDFAEMVVRHALGQPVPTRMNYRQGVYLRYILPDILWFIRSPHRFRSKPSWFSFRNTTDQVFSLEDPMPGLTYALKAGMKFLKETR